MIEKQEVKSVSWCDSSSQIAKCLTKVGASSEKTSPCFERGRQINQLQKQKFALNDNNNNREKKIICVQT